MQTRNDLMLQQFPLSQASGSAEDTVKIIRQLFTKMDGCLKDDAPSSEDMASETKSSEDQKQASDEVKLSSKLGRPPKEKSLDRVSSKHKVDALLDEEVSRNTRLKKRNKEIQERLQRVVKLYTSLIEGQRIVFLKPREPE